MRHIIGEASSAGRRAGPSASSAHFGFAAESEKCSMDPEPLSALIGEIYDAALDSTLWPAVIGKAVKLLPGFAGALFVKDISKTSGEVHYDDGVIEPAYKQSYFERYAKIDPTYATQFFAEVGRPVSTTDLLSYDEFRESRFYKEWVQPQGMVDAITAVLDKSPTSAAMFGIFRHERHGLIDNDARRRMQLIVPHVRRAVLIGGAINLKTAEAATFSGALDGLEAGIFFVDGRGCMVHVNAAGQTMIAQGDMLRTAAGRLVATDARANDALSDVVTIAGRGDVAIGVKGIALALSARDGGEYIANVLPLTAGVRRKAAAEYAAVAAIFVRKAQLDTPAVPAVIAKRYGLTPSELRVLLAVFDAGGISDVAETLGVSQATAKTHLRRLFAKTGTGRQAELVKLVAGFAAANP